MIEWIEVKDGKHPENCSLYLGKYIDKSQDIELNVTKRVQAANGSSLIIIGHVFGFDRKDLTLIAYCSLDDEVGK